MYLLLLYDTYILPVPNSTFHSIKGGNMGMRNLACHASPGACRQLVVMGSPALIYIRSGKYYQEKKTNSYMYGVKRSARLLASTAYTRSSSIKVQLQLQLPGVLYIEVLVLPVEDLN